MIIPPTLPLPFLLLRDNLVGAEGASALRAAWCDRGELEVTSDEEQNYFDGEYFGDEVDDDAYYYGDGEYEVGYVDYYEQHLYGSEWMDDYYE